MLERFLIAHIGRIGNVALGLAIEQVFLNSLIDRKELALLRLSLFRIAVPALDFTLGLAPNRGFEIAAGDLLIVNPAGDPDGEHRFRNDL